MTVYGNPLHRNRNSPPYPDNIELAHELAVDDKSMLGSMDTGGLSPEPRVNIFIIFIFILELLVLVFVSVLSYFLR